MQQERQTQLPYYSIVFNMNHEENQLPESVQRLTAQYLERYEGVFEQVNNLEPEQKNMVGDLLHEFLGQEMLSAEEYVQALDTVADVIKSASPSEIGEVTQVLDTYLC